MVEPPAIAAILAATLLAASAAADVLPTPRPSAERKVSGIVRGFAGSSLALADPRSGVRTNFDLDGHRGPARADAIGLRLGDSAIVTLRDDPGRTPEVQAVDRVLPDRELSVRVFAVDAPLAQAGLGEGPGCWIAQTATDGYEICFLSPSQGLAIRYQPGGALACTARLSPQRGGQPRRLGASRASCQDGASWPLVSVRCDAKTLSCTLGVSDQPETALAVTRR